MDVQIPVNIDKRTNVPLFAVLASLPVLVGAILWLSSIDSKASAAQKDLEDLKPVVTKISETLIEIKTELKLEREAKGHSAMDRRKGP